MSAVPVQEDSKRSCLILPHSSLLDEAMDALSSLATYFLEAAGSGKFTVGLSEAFDAS